MKTLFLRDAVKDFLVNGSLTDEREIRSLRNLVDALNTPEHLDIVFQTEVVRVEDHDADLGTFPTFTATGVNKQDKFILIASVLQNPVSVLCIATNNVRLNPRLTESILKGINFQVVPTNHDKFVIFFGKVEHTLPFIRFEDFTVGKFITLDGATANLMLPRKPN